MNKQQIKQLAHNVLGYKKGEGLQPLEQDHLTVATRILEKAVQTIRNQALEDAAKVGYDAAFKHANENDHVVSCPAVGTAVMVAIRHLKSN